MQFFPCEIKTYLAALGDGVGLLVLVGAHAEVLHSLTGVALATEEDGVRAGGRAESELVEGQSLAASLENALLGRLGEAQGGSSQLGDLKQTDIIGDGADNDDGLSLAVDSAGSLLQDAGEGDRRAVDLGEEQAVEDGLAEHA